MIVAASVACKDLFSIIRGSHDRRALRRARSRRALTDIMSSSDELLEAVDLVADKLWLVEHERSMLLIASWAERKEDAPRRQETRTSGRTRSFGAPNTGPQGSVRPANCGTLRAAVTRLLHAWQHAVCARASLCKHCRLQVPYVPPLSRISAYVQTKARSTSYEDGHVMEAGKTTAELLVQRSTLSESLFLPHCLHPPTPRADFYKSCRPMWKYALAVRYSILVHL